MKIESEGVAALFDELRARLNEVAGDDDVLAELVAALQEGVAHQAQVVDQILDRLPVGITVTDPQYRVTRFNQRAGEIIGQMVEETDSMDEWVVDLFHLDGTPMEFADRPAIRALGGETSRNVVFEARDTERAPYLVNASSTPIRDATGKVVFAVTVFDDITEGRRRAEADRDFVANAAHQIRSPIAAIASACGALSAGAKASPDARDRFLEHIEREVARMEQLANGLLALARAERGDVPAPLSEIALKPLLQRVSDGSATKDGVDLEVFCADDLIAFTNEALVTEALANVVANAVQHTARGTVSLRGEHARAGAIIEVRDEGPGIADQDRERIFERFYRGPRPATAGVGLGLAIAAAATSAAGGVLELVDSPVGACFRFTFTRTAPSG
ncbi:MAG TPA: PAS domain-containing sensor histidine kinase [Gaiellaceae bacterium]|jgi:PAS domain S-box-containing protein|nr:PAS domain-containing sensor histidine kinase [Gaiellaceae bacterium]